MIDAQRIASKLWMGSFPSSPATCAGRFKLVVLAAYELQTLPYPCRERVLRVPLDDHAPTAEESALAVRAAMVVNRARGRGERVLVTCAQGLNRSGLIVALALVLEGHGPGTAIEMVRRGRKHPIGLTPLSNRHFVDLVHRVAARRSMLQTSYSTQG